MNPGAVSGVTVSSFTVVSNTQITATLAIAATASTTTISVTNPNGASNAVTLGIVPALISPTLVGIAPSSKPAGTSVNVTLTGTSLTGATAINAGANITVSNLVVVNPAQIAATFAIASGAAQGNRNITVTTPGGTTNAVVFNVLPPPPAITQINSPFGRGNNQGVTLQGTNFTGANAITAVTVLLNGGAVPINNPALGPSITASGFQAGAAQLRWQWTIPATLPPSSGTNAYTITVTTLNGTSAPFAFTVQ